ncbi:lipopolysaccharide/colanic/teichoic acid biosynthesis glycosyltransferase [Crenobacter luteus]|uniref:Sugar transferase n=1 Tax=Crenobacter luteus TaxID=1452487 RepID=A0A163C761_9NEIS|nr:sugar transferase [Crenobacter luteus]KZE30272.1 sugar transferase [Crenobacter luteus]TCP10731.1 lipopolysaccharide/colanic/teichoic acid biosynthesis glycosyltransferase [Crenobacter luteus]
MSEVKTLAEPARGKPGRDAVKRAFDVVCAALGLLLLSPLLVAVALWIKLDSTGPVFFRQERVGRHGVPFRIHKFRTMRVDAEKHGQLTVGRDNRVTRAGAFLRKSKLDELPQLIDVLVGTMSLVGPRPEVPRYVAHYPADVKARVLSVRPGITEWASIEMIDENDILAAAPDPERAYLERVLPEKLAYAARYADGHTLCGDVAIILATLKKIVTR